LNLDYSLRIWSQPVSIVCNSPVLQANHECPLIMYWSGADQGFYTCFFSHFSPFFLISLFFLHFHALYSFIFFILIVFCSRFFSIILILIWSRFFFYSYFHLHAFFILIFICSRFLFLYLFARVFFLSAGPLTAGYTDLIGLPITVLAACMVHVHE